MDLGTLVGMLGGTAVVLAAIFIGGNFSSFVDVPSMFIVHWRRHHGDPHPLQHRRGVRRADDGCLKVTFGGASGNCARA